MRFIIHPSRRIAFTLVELLVVISIILIVIAAILPAFGRLIESQNYASAVNAVTAALSNARSQAIATGRRTGVVFLWDAKQERCSLQIVELLNTEATSLTNNPTNRIIGAYCESFQPVRGSAPIVLPRRIGVFGLSSLLPPADSSENDTEMTSTPQTWWWYAGEVLDQGTTSDTADDIIPWIFPRNDPRLFLPAPAGDNIGADAWAILRGESIAGVTTAQALIAVRNCTTFFVQFSEQGQIVLPRRSGGSSFFDAYVEYTTIPVDQSNPTGDPYDANDRFDPETFAGVTLENRQANPEYMMRGADQLAIVDLGRLAEGVGVPRPWLARPLNSRAPQPTFLADYFNDDLVRSVSRWIDRNAEVVNFNRYSGNAIRRSAL